MMTTTYAAQEPTRLEVDTLAGATVIEFGTPWCGHCKAVQPLLAKAFATNTDVRHLKVEDGSGRPLGRSFRVKLWPTLIFIRDGQEIARLVRPAAIQLIADALEKLQAGG